MNEFIYNYLNEYAATPDPQYAVMLKGKWGCGKTHFINKWLKEYKVTSRCEDEAAIDLKPIYISLYGMTTIAEIQKAIDREVNPFFYSKTGKVLSGAAKLVGKMVFHTSFDITGDGKDDTSFSGSLDPMSLFKKSNEDVIKGIRFIVFDDIERCQIEMKTLLGFINYFVEHCDCHVVMVGDEDHFEEKNKSVLDEFREKTIGREFEIEADVEDAVDGFLVEPYISDYLRCERDFIIRCFKSTGYDNLRVLRQCLMDFSAQISDVKFKKKVKSNLFLHGLMGSFIAVYAELNNKQTQEYFQNYSDFYQSAVYNLDSEKGKALKALNIKYNEVSKGSIYHVLTVEYVTRIVQHIKKGVPMNEFIKSNIDLKPKTNASWEKMQDFWQISNEEFDTMYEKVLEELFNNQIELPYQIGTTIGYLSYFDAVGVRVFESEDQKKVKKKLEKLICGSKTLEELFQKRISLMQGINYVRMGDEKCPTLDGVLQCIQEAFEKKNKELPDAMQQALRNLSDENVFRLSTIDDESYPDHSSAYQLRAIFEYEDSDKLFQRICSLSNKGKNEFCAFLSKHYLFSAYLKGMEKNRYKPDEKVLKELKVKIEGKVAEAEKVDLFSYKRLVAAFDKAIQRCEGSNNPL